MWEFSSKQSISWSTYMENYDFSYFTLWYCSKNADFVMAITIRPKYLCFF